MAHNLKIFTVPFLTGREHEKGGKELDRIVKNLPTLTAESERSQSRGQKIILKIKSLRGKQYHR